MTESDPGRVERIRPYQLGLGKAFELLRDGVVVADAGSGRIVFWNHAAEAVFGYTAEEAIDAPVEMLMPERMRPLHRHGLSRFNRTGQGGYIDAHTPIDLPAVRRDGEEIAIQLTLTALGDMPVPGRFVMAIVRDITERIRQDEEMRRGYSRLQAELLRRREGEEE